MERIDRTRRNGSDAAGATARGTAAAFIGVHCETVATGTLLGAIGCELSEPMLFGLGEALGFVFLNLANFPLPFLGGRSKPSQRCLSLPPFERLLIRRDSARPRFGAGCVTRTSPLRTGRPATGLWRQLTYRS